MNGKCFSRISRTEIVVDSALEYEVIRTRECILCVSVCYLAPVDTNAMRACTFPVMR